MSITQTEALPGLSTTVHTTNEDGSGSGLAADFIVNAANAGTYSWKVVYTPAAGRWPTLAVAACATTSTPT